ncbi:Endocytosis and vacuole integrity protein [Thecaphora frezii]
MSQLIILELGSLASEARRKHPEIKQAADAALQQLKAHPDAALQRSRLDHGPAAENLVLKPILLSCSTKLPKVLSIAMTLLQRLVLQQMVPSTSISAIVHALHDLLTPINRTDVDVQLKILQIASALLSSYSLIHGELLASTLLLCFKLQEGSKVAAVSSTAAATLRQSVMTVFDRVKEEDVVLDGIKYGGEDAAAAAPLAAMTAELPSGPVTLFPAAKDAYLLFSDLCLLANGEQAEFLALTSLSKTFSLELVESVLTNHARLFSTRLHAVDSNTHPELLYILRSKTCPLLIRALSEAPSFPIHLRSMRLLFLLLRQFSADLVLEVEILMTMLLRFVRPSSRDEQGAGSATVYTWQRVLALEVTRSLCSDDAFLRNLWTWYDSGNRSDAEAETGIEGGGGSSRGGGASTKVFALLLETLYSVVKEGQGTFAAEGSMSTGLLRQQAEPGAGSPRRSRIRESLDRGYSGLYEAAAGVASAAISGAFGTSEASGAEVLAGSSSPAIQIIDQLDKTEPPALASTALPRTYLQLLALQSFLFLSQSIVGYVLPIYSQFVNARPAGSAPAPPAIRDNDVEALGSEADRNGLRASKAMLELAAPALRDVLSHFLQVRCAESIFEDTLVAFRNLTNAVGALGLEELRDALLGNLIIFALHIRSPEAPSADQLHSIEDAAAADRLSTRNLACLRALAQVAYYLSGSLETGWYPVLRCLCYAHSVLDAGLARAEGRGEPDGSAEDAEPSDFSHDTMSTLTRTPFTSLSSRSGKDQLQLLSPADLRSTALKKQIQRVFENSTALDDGALRHFIAALCRHSNVDVGLQLPEEAGAASQLPSSMSRASLRTASGSVEEKQSFPIASISLVASLNVGRLAAKAPELGWSVIFDHLRGVCSAEHVLTGWRLQASEVAMKFLFAAIATEDEGLALAERRRIQAQSLEVMSRFAVLERRRSTVTDMEVRRMGLDTLFRILEARGHALLLGWETICDVCSAACDQTPPASASASAPPSAPAASAVQKGCVTLVKVAFSCVQIVCSDFLPTLTVEQLRRCISCLTEFGKQLDDVNVALTANGSLWAVTAELATRAAKITDADDGAAIQPADLSELWLFLLHCLSQITRDTRSEVRNGAISNLFRVLEQYGTDLSPLFWQKAFWEILFPVIKALDATAIQLEDNAGAAVSEAEDRKAQAMGLAQSQPRQWDESRAIALGSLGNVVRDFVATKLVDCAEFASIWSTLLLHVRVSFLRGPPPISQASIKMFSTMLAAQIRDAPSQESQAKLQAAWGSAWECWSAMGASLHDRSDAREVERPPRPFTQVNLLAYTEAFWPLYRELRPSFDAKQAEAVMDRLKTCMAYADSPDYPGDVDSLTPLQAAARKVTRTLDPVPGLPSLKLDDLADNLSLAFTSTGAVERPEAGKQQPVTFVALAKACIADAAMLFEADEQPGQVDLNIYRDGAVEHLLSALTIPVKLKYDGPSASRYAKDVRPLWQSASIALCRVVQRCCDVLDGHGADLGEAKVVAIWRGVVDSLEAALSADCSGATGLSTERREADERFDLCLLATIENHVLPAIGHDNVPDELIRQLGRALVANSRPCTVQSPASGSGGCAQDGPTTHVPAVPSLGLKVELLADNPRERFAYWCFDLAMLACSDRFAERTAERKRVAALMLTTLLDRSEEVMSGYVRDAALRGMSPMPRVREEELNYVLSSFLGLRLWPSSLAAAYAKDPSRAIREQEDAITVPASSAGIRTAMLRSTRAHLFACYHSLCDLASLRLPPGAMAVYTTAGSSLPQRIATQQIEGELAAKQLRLGLVGRGRGIFVTTAEDGAEGGGGGGGTLHSADLARRALALVAEEMGVPPRRR